MLADHKVQTSPSPNPGTAIWSGTIDPTTEDQWPAKRHNGRTDVMWADGHASAEIRHDMIDPANGVWRSRWNIDHQPHTSDVPTWSPNWASESKAD
ncbi:MAG: hypothetical protein WDM76_03720 [Limisphaerales bacterium]